MGGCQCGVTIGVTWASSVVPSGGYYSYSYSSGNVQVVQTCASNFFLHTSDATARRVSVRAVHEQGGHDVQGAGRSATA